MKTRSNTGMVLAGLLALALTVMVGPAGQASAQDVKWTGAYVGASVGHASTKTTADADVTGFGNILTVDGLGTNGPALGLIAGFDMQFDRFVLGAFVDYTWHDQTWSVASPLIGGTLASLDFDNQWTIGARAGVTVGNALVYGLVGYTQMQTSDLTVPPAALSFSVPDFKGVTVGGGVEVALGSGFFLGAEYRYTAFDKERVDLVPGFLGMNLEPEMHQVNARVSYKFGM